MVRLKLVGDVNGDGILDLINYGNSEYASNSPGSDDIHGTFIPNRSYPNWDKRGDVTTAFGSRYISPGGANTGFTTTTSCKGPSWSDMDGDWDGGVRSVFMADMDGDSLSDIVVVGRSQVRYWPSDGRGDYTSCRGLSCSCTTPTSSASYSSFIPYDLGPNADPAHIRIADVNGDGFADLISWDKDGLRVYLNFDGWMFEAPILISGFWFDSEWSKAVSDNAVEVSFADMNRNEITDIVVGVHNNIHGLDLHRLVNVAQIFAPNAWAPRPGLLVRIDNGLGLKSSIAYTTTSDLASTALYLHKPWPEHLPQTLQVVMKLTTETSAPNEKPVTTYYDYDDPAWDGWERRFRGFRRVTMVSAGNNSIHDTQTNPITTTQTFYFPSCPDAFCGSLDPTFSHLRAAEGVPLVTEISDAQNHYLSTVSRSYTVVDIADGMDGRGVRSAYASQVDSRLYDTNDWVSSGSTVEQTIEAAIGRERAKLWTGPVPVRGLSSVLTRVSNEQDKYGNVVKSVEHGRIKEDGSPIDDPIVTSVTTRPPRPDWRFVPESKQTDAFPTRSGVAPDHSRLLFFEQDSDGRLSSVSSALIGVLPLDRHHEDLVCRGCPGPSGGIV